MLPRPFSNKAAYLLERPKDTRIIGLISSAGEIGHQYSIAISRTILPVVVGGWMRLSGASTLMIPMTSHTWTSFCLQTLLKQKVELNDKSFFGLWNESLEAGYIYVKLDDDVVYIDDDSIPIVVDTLVTNTESSSCPPTWLILLS